MNSFQLNMIKAGKIILNKFKLSQTKNVNLVTLVLKIEKQSEFKLSIKKLRENLLLIKYVTTIS